MFAAVAVELAAAPDKLRQLIDEVEDLTGAPRVILGREFLSVPELCSCRWQPGVETQLVLLRTLAGARSLSLWTIGPDDELKRLGQTGKIDGMVSPARQLAARILRGEADSADETSAIAAVLVERWQQPAAALIATGKPAAGSQRAALMQDAVPLLSTMLERDDLHPGTTGSDAAAMASAERAWPASGSTFTMDHSRTCCSSVRTSSSSEISCPPCWKIIPSASARSGVWKICGHDW
jgi:hypothetical protein